MFCAGDSVKLIFMPRMRDEFLTVSELNHFIRDVLASGFPQAVWVCGEIQGYDRGKDKKHVFFELCEKDPATHEIIARVGLVIFATRRPAIDAILQKAENAFVLKDDIEVKFSCKVDFYPGHGQVRLIVENIDPVYTLGKIAQDRQRLIALLKQKGTLDRNKKLTMPRVPLNVGLITSYDSAAYHDFLDELKKSGYGFRVFAINALMQGKNAEKSVVGALKTLNAVKELDVVVITRGGGSIAELSCFDSQVIAEAIAASRLPVLSGIGHEINTTVTDLAAHTFAKTPTAVAQFLVNRVREFLSDLQSRALALQSGTKDFFKAHHEHMARRIETLRRVPVTVAKASRLALASRGDGLKKTIHLRLQNSRAKIQAYQKLAEMADPKNTLKRGFSITRDDRGKAVRSTAVLKLKQEITTELADGVFIAEVRKVC